MKNGLLILLTIGGLAWFLSCSKSVKDDKLYIRGRLFYTDTITRYTIGQPVPGRLVKLANNSTDSLNFLYSDTTDAGGYFLFNLLDRKKDSYAVRFQDSLDGVYYLAVSKVDRGNDTIALVATVDTVRQNGFVIHLEDSLSGYIPAATVRLFNSEVLAGTNDSASAVQQFTSDSYGKIYRLTLPVGKYYLNAIKKAGSLTLQRLMKVIIIPRTTGIVSDTMTLN